MIRARTATLSSFVLVLDALVVFFAMWGAFRGHEVLRPFVPMLEGTPARGMLLVFAVAALPIHLVLVVMLGVHRSVERGLTSGALVLALVKLACLEFLALAALGFLTQSVVNRSIVAIYLGLSFVIMFVAHALIRRWWRYQHASGQARTRVLVVGDAGTAALERLKARVAAGPWPDVIVGRVGDGSDTLGSLAELGEVLHREAVDRVVFLPPFHQPGEQLDALAECEKIGVPALFALELEQPLEARPTVGRLHGESWIVFDVAPKRPELLALKHAGDFLLTVLGLIVLLPILALVGLAILVTMGRPVFFVQERAGLHGRTFRMFKFRTMVPDAEARKVALLAANEMSGPVFKVTNDPRITPLGAFLRQTSLDELPQLFNVLTGAMSLVGPRPLPSAEQARITGWHRRRLSMKPGITGLWQVSGRSDVDFENWMELDLRYIDEWSLGRDFLLLLRTIPAVLVGRGAK